ncbi:hypothetical protein FRB94_002968 [Tulasnella sp. JGI-2019a]|nr:hypothetical protein FRB94_002968 [Tulasnella sp. JGI-2019a]
MFMDPNNTEGPQNLLSGLDTFVQLSNTPHLGSLLQHSQGGSRSLIKVMKITAVTTHQIGYCAMLFYSALSSDVRLPTLDIPEGFSHTLLYMQIIEEIFRLDCNQYVVR